MSKTTIAKSILPAFVTVTIFLAVQVSALPPAPPNDDPGSAEPIGPGVPVVVYGTTVLADDSISVTTPPSPADDLDRGVPTRGEWTIVATYPIPEGASGLAYDGEYLYCGIYGANGDEVYRIDPVTGSYVLLFTGPQEDAYGLTYDGTYLWTTDHPGSSSIPAVAMKLDWSGNLLTQFNLPAHYMSGIAYDNGDFWVARYYDDPGHLYKVDTDGVILDEFDAPDNQPWDLCIENGNLWMADYWGDTLYKIDLKSGDLLDSHLSEGVDPAGIVWDGEFLWYCDNGEGFDQDYLYKVDLAGGGAPVINIPVSSHDFGTISIGDSETWDMTVGNVGVADLNITAVTFSPPDDLSCPITFPVIIPPDGSEPLPVVYAPDDFGPLDATATVFSNDPIHPEEEVTLTGHGVYPGPTINVPEDVHDYGSVRINATTRWFMQIRNHGNEMLTIDDIVIDDTHFYLDDAVSLPIHIGTLSSVDIGVWFSPDSATSYAATVAIYSNDPYQNPANVFLSGAGVQALYPMGQELWSYLIDTGYDNSPKAIAPIPDVSGDGIADVIVCSEDDFIRCFNGNAHGTGDVLWEHEIYAGSVYSANALQVNEDVDGDGYHDVVVGSAWGGRLIRTLSGKTGLTIWTHDTDEYGDGGWVYDVDCSYDYNDDGVVDVLAATGDDATDTGPKRAYCLDGVTGVSIWETPLGGPGFAVIGVEDFTEDKQPDAVAGASNEDETVGRVYGIDGADGSIDWTYLVYGSSVWAVEQIDDITADEFRDVIVGDFSFVDGFIYGLDATSGDEEYFRSGYGAIIHLERLDDVNGDGHPDVVPAHFGTTARVIDGQTGNPIWSTPLVDKSAAVAAIADLNDDGVNDVLIGTLYTNNYAYFLDGADGAVLKAINYGTPVDAIGAIPDIVGDGSWEMVVGGRNGLVTCFSGGIGDHPRIPLPEDSLGIPCTIDSDCWPEGENEAKCVQGVCYVPKNRHISFSPQNAGEPTALRVTHVGSGLHWWVSEPDADGIARLEDAIEPSLYRDWSLEAAVIHAGDCPIVPDATYDVQAIFVNGNPADEGDYSQALTLPTTDVWGDVAGPPDEGVSTPPDETVGIDDVMAAVAYFQGSPTAPPMPWVDIAPEEPDSVIGIDEIMAIIGAFQGEDYPFSAPESCP